MRDIGLTPEPKAQVLVAEAHAKLMDYRQYAIEQVKLHTELMAFWEREVAEVNTYVTQNGHDVMEERATSEMIDVADPVPGRYDEEKASRSGSYTQARYSG